MRLRVIDILNSKYTFVSDNGIYYELDLIFIDKNIIINIDDIIHFPSKIINENNIYNYGPIYKSDSSIDEYIKVERKDEEFYLQRYYG